MKGLPLLSITDVILYSLNLLSLPIVLIINFLRISFGQFFSPAQQALIPSTVPSELLPEANSLNQSTNLLVSAAIPIMSGILISIVNPITVFYLDAASFILSAVFLFGLSLPDLYQAPPNSTRPSILIDIGQGIKYIFNEPVLRVIAIVNLINIFGFGPYRPITILYFQENLGMTSEQYGLNLSLAFLGLAVGSTIGGTWVRRFGTGYIYVGGLILMGVITIGVGLTPWSLSIYGLSFVRSFGNGLIVIAYTTLLQSQTADERRGRVFGTMETLSEVARPLAVAIAAGLADVTTFPLVIVLSGVMFLISALIGMFNHNLRLARISS